MSSSDSVKPEGSARWKGKFQSITYGWVMVMGSVDTWLLDDPQAEYSTPFSLNYTGLYRYGARVDGLVEVKPGQMTITQPGQVITFSVTNRTAQKITGTYHSTGRNDDGSFELILA